MQKVVVREDAVVSDCTDVDGPGVVTGVEEEQFGGEPKWFVALVHNDHRESLFGHAQLTAIRPVNAHLDERLVAVETRLQVNVVLTLVDYGQAHA